MSREFWKNVGLNLCFWLSLAFSLTFFIKPQWVLIKNGDIHQKPKILPRGLGLPRWEQISNCILHIYRKLQAGRTGKTLPFFQSHVKTNILCFLDEDIACRNLSPYWQSLCPHPRFAPGRNCTGPLPQISPEAYVVWHWCDEVRSNLNSYMLEKRQVLLPRNLSSQILSFHAQVEEKWFVHLIIN